MKYLFSLLMFVHGLIHLMGFAKGFGMGKLPALTTAVSKPRALLWLFTALLFTVATAYYLLEKNNWIFFTVVAVLQSQLLIVWYWRDAKMGTAVNILILMLLTLQLIGFNL